MRDLFLTPGSTGLIAIDIQDKLLAHIERPCEVMDALKNAVKGFSSLNMPLLVTEQVPEKLGSTTQTLAALLPKETPIFSKSSFSCLGNPYFKEMILSLPVKNWVLCGLESHICVLQTAKALIGLGKGVVVLNDAISSRSIFDYSTAIAEMRDMGVRISSVETILFELIGDAEAAKFKVISEIVK